VHHLCRVSEMSVCIAISVPVIETDGIVEKPDMSEAKIVVAMVSKISSTKESCLCDQVGLPARGKSYLSNKLMRYLRVSDCRLSGRVQLIISGWNSMSRCLMWVN